MSLNAPPRTLKFRSEKNIFIVYNSKQKKKKSLHKLSVLPRLQDPSSSDLTWTRSCCRWSCVSIPTLKSYQAIEYLIRFSGINIPELQLTIRLISVWSLKHQKKAKRPSQFLRLEGDVVSDKEKLQIITFEKLESVEFFLHFCLKNDRND